MRLATTNSGGMNADNGVRADRNPPGRRESPAELRRVLEREFTTATDPVAVGPWQFDIMRPRNADDLISEADFVRDERLPYWADLWPSARVLAGALSESAPPAGGRRPRLLELGCGLGLATSAALRAGYDVTATDYYADALRFTRVNAWRSARRVPKTRLVDWRAFPADLGAFDRVIAADVLYEHRYAPLITEAIVQTLAPGGAAVVADPGRIAAPAFLEGLSAHGLMLSATEVRAFDEGTIHQQISLYTIRRRDEA
jgi:predicted nicotinamide N-methyase